MANHQVVTIQQNIKSDWPPFPVKLSYTNLNEADTGIANNIY